MKKLSLLLVAGLTMVSLQAADLQKCVGCHGQKFEKPALGKSKIVKNMSEEEIVKALKGYRTGTYGGPMKGIMKGQVQNINDEEVAKAIKELNKSPIEKKLEEAKKKVVQEEPVSEKTEVINMRENALNQIRDCINKATTLQEIEACKK